jgi:predicted RNase H-like nuclease
MRFLGVDLAWGEGSSEKAANRSGVVAIDEGGRVLDAGWTIGLDETVAWMTEWGAAPALAFVDAPLLVTNESGPRDCDREVGRRFGRHLVSANTVNLASPRRAGTHLRERLVGAGWTYDDSRKGPPRSGRALTECYPYTTLVGAQEFAFHPRPPYKRKPKRFKTMAEFWPERLCAWDAIVGRLVALKGADPPLDIDSHAATGKLRATPVAGKASAYKQAEDLLDAVICAWTAALWWRHGYDKCAVLGSAGAGADPTSTIVAPVSGLESAT